MPYIPYRTTYLVVAQEDRLNPTWTRYFGPFGTMKQAEEYAKKAPFEKGYRDASVPMDSKMEVVTIEDPFKE